MRRPSYAIVAMVQLLASCSLVTGFGDLDFTNATTDAGLDAGRDARRADDGTLPDRPLGPDAMRDVLTPDAPIRDMARDAIELPDAADMAVVTPCGVCPPAPACAVAVCTSAGCATALVAAGAACDDGNACTESTRCNAAGNCVGGTTCPDDGDVCTEELCTPDGCGATSRIDGYPCGATSDHVCCAGRCVNTFVDAASCGECGNRCIWGGCVAGGCSRSCDTPEICTPAGAPLCVTSSCDLGTGCTLTPTNNFCLIDGACYVNGETPPDNRCWQCDVTFSTTAWTPIAAETPCDDGLSCSTGETCDGNGRCGAGEETCRIDGDCALATCIEGVSGCTPRSAPDGSACADGRGVCCAATCFTDRTFCP